MTLSEEISGALQIERTEDSIQALKAHVANHLSALDVRAEIRWTDYFNHSFVPDMVMRWPHSGEGERQVFLRFDANGSWLRSDVQHLRSRHPIIFGLTVVDDGAADPALPAAAAEADILVTDPSGLDQLESVREGLAPFFGRTALRSGRGYLDVPTATSLTTVLPAGFAGAKEGNVETTTSAVAIADSLFVPAEADRMVRLMQSLWEGSNESAFPLERDMPPNMNVDSLDYLLGEADLDDFDFWRAVGEGLTLERLVRLSVRNDNFQRFLAANLGRLWARALRVKLREPRIPQQLWDVEQGMLCLHLRHCDAYIASALPTLKQHVPIDDRRVQSVIATA